MHNFDVHLLALSKSDEIQIAKTEWFEIYREHRAEKTGLCICQHTLQHIIYMYNIYTNYTISVGVGCCKKFKIKLNILDKILKRVMTESIAKGEYKIINNILEYTTSIELQLLAFLKKEGENDDLKTLKELSINIQELIETYNLTYAMPIYEQLKNKIKEIERKKIEEETEKEIQRKKIEEEKKEIQRKKIEEEKKDQIEEKQKKRSIEENQKKEKEKVDQIEEKQRKEKLERESIQCNCRIKVIDICICQTPHHTFCKLSTNIYCANCNKWKCRC